MTYTTIASWQLQTPINAIVFDCDGTLSTIEGIDELAKYNDCAPAVSALTEQAMGKTGINPEIYAKRLNLVNPRLEHVLALGKQYFATQVPDIAYVIQILKRLNKKIFLVSAGLYPAVKTFGELLHIPSENIFAVDIQFDENGNYLHYEHTSPLTYADGKREIVSQLKSQHKNVLYVGDGLNDYVTYDIVTRFVGYGGVFYRKNIEELCQYYIHTPSMSALLPLTLTLQEYASLTADEKKLYQKGLEAIENKKVKV